MLHWLEHSPNARLLAQLTVTGHPFTHDLLDQLPPSRHEHYVRQILMHHGVLPQRHEEVDRIPVWLDHLLADQPADHAKLIRPFAHWVVLKRARRKASQDKTPTTASSYLRTTIKVILELLIWLDEQQLSLHELTQPQLDNWLTAGNSRNYHIRYFLDWATQRGLAHRLKVPAIPHRLPAHILDEHEHWQQLDRCLHDQTMPLEVRVAGSLVLLFGLHTSRIRKITSMTCTNATATPTSTSARTP